MDVIEGSISSTIETLRNYLAIDNLHTDEDGNQPKVIVVYNVEKVAVNELKRLDFLFALVERSFEHTSTIVLLLWNTDIRPLTAEDTELHDDDGDDTGIDSMEDGQTLSLRDLLAKEWSKSGSLVNGDALAGRLAGTAHCPTCYTSSESNRGAVPSPLTVCLSRKEELDRILLNKIIKKKKILLDTERWRKISAAVFVLIVTFVLLGCFLPELKAVNVVNIQEQPLPAPVPVPIPPPQADKTLETEGFPAATKAEDIDSRVEGTENSISPDASDKSEPAGDSEPIEPSTCDVTLDPAQPATLLPDTVKALSQSVQDILPTTPRYHTRSRFKD